MEIKIFQLQVMVVRGPNRRTDFHIEAGEEFFYQLKGDMVLRVIMNNQFQSISIRQGQAFLLPAQIPHSPQRTPDSIGIVVERQRAVDELDRLLWYCDHCNKVVHEERFHCKELDSQLTPIMNKVASNPNLNRCRQCGISCLEPVQTDIELNESVLWPYQRVYPLPFNLNEYISKLKSQEKSGRYRLFSDSTHFQVEVAFGDFEEQRQVIHEVWFLQLSSRVELMVNATTIIIEQGQTYLMPPNQTCYERNSADSIGITVQSIS